METRSLLFGLIFALSFLGMVGAAIYLHLRARRVAGASWQGLLARLVTVDRDRLALLAESDGSSNPGQPARELEPQEIWDLVGGMKGLEALAANCGVLIELACMVQGTYPEALLIAEQLRLNAREVQWHVTRLSASTKTAENLHTAFPHYARSAAMTYVRMTQNVLALYEAAEMPAYPALQRAL